MTYIKLNPEKYELHKQKCKERVLNKYHNDEEYKKRQIENKRLLRIKKREEHYEKWDNDPEYRQMCKDKGMRDRRPK